jgi:HAD superfamily hydrolase (TIGR01509 family)
MKIKGILFDFNGTLYFDNRMDIDSLNRSLVEFGGEERDVHYIVSNIFGRDNFTVFRQNVRADATDEELWSFCRLKSDLYMQNCRSMPGGNTLAKGAAEMLDELKARGIPYCLATGSEWYRVEFYMEHLGLSRWFTPENIVFADGTYPCKPAPDIYRLAAKKIGLTPEECLVFEDGSSGIISANRAGAGAVVLVHEAGYPCPLDSDTRVDKEFNDFADWKTILNEYGIL